MKAFSKRNLLIAVFLLLLSDLATVVLAKETNFEKDVKVPLVNELWFSGEESENSVNFNPNRTNQIVIKSKYFSEIKFSNEQHFTYKALPMQEMGFENRRRVPIFSTYSSCILLP